jgi:hypothetical protein
VGRVPSSPLHSKMKNVAHLVPISTFDCPMACVGIWIGCGSAHLLMPLTSSEAHGWCMLRHQPPSEISCSSRSWSLSLDRSGPALSSGKATPFSGCRMELPPTSTHWENTNFVSVEISLVKAYHNDESKYKLWRVKCINLVGLH